MIIYNNLNHLLAMILIESGNDDPKSFFKRIYAVGQTKINPHKEKVKTVSRFIKTQLGSPISGFIKQKLLKDSTRNKDVDNNNDNED